MGMGTATRLWSFGFFDRRVGGELLPPRAVLDVPLALAIVVIGVLTIVDPSSVPGLTPM
jgi:hypothetical protein